MDTNAATVTTVHALASRTFHASIALNQFGQNAVLCGGLLDHMAYAVGKFGTSADQPVTCKRCLKRLAA